MLLKEIVKSLFTRVYYCFAAARVESVCLTKQRMFVNIFALFSCLGTSIVVFEGLYVRVDKGRVWRFLYSCAQVLFPHDYPCFPFPHNYYTTSNWSLRAVAAQGFLMWGGGGGTRGKTSILEGKCWKQIKKTIQVLTCWLRGPETLNKLAKEGGGGGGLSPCPSPVASTAAIHSLLQSWIGSSVNPGSTLIFQQELRGYPIQFTIYHRCTPSPPPPHQPAVRRVMKDCEINV